MSDEKTFLESWFDIIFGVDGRVVSWPRVECRGQGWGTLQYNRSIAEAPLCLNGQTYERGLGTHAHSEIVVRLPRPGRRLHGLAGVDDNTLVRADGAAPGRMEFAVETGGGVRWKSRPLGVADAPATVDADLGGAMEFTLRARDLRDDIRLAHADWVDLRVTLEDGCEISVVPPLPGGPVGANPPFSFRYGGKPSAELLTSWEFASQAIPAPVGATGRLATWKDPQSGLVCEAEAMMFNDHSAVEWVLRFRNTGAADTPILEDVQALDLGWASGGEGGVLHRSRGSRHKIDDFLYQSDALLPSQPLQMTAGGGRSSSEWLPFFNLHAGDRGLMLAVGWTGSWAAEFCADANNVVQARAGMERTRLRLHASEEIRTPRMLMLAYRGDALTGHNALRRFILQHHTPTQDGHPAVAPICAGTWGGMRTADHLAQIRDIRTHGLAYDYYWIDAGWYGPADSVSPDVYHMGWAVHVGHWAVNPAAHPQGLKPIADAAHAAGMKFLLWFEPERARVGTPWTITHPEWFLKQRRPGDNLLFDLGNPAAREWLTDFISNCISELGIDCYRQDFNFDPLPYWRDADAPDREGITEIRHIEGLYAFWDELRRRHPGLLIDNCASGGRRIDLETTGRSIPLWRSDWQCNQNFDPVGAQIQTFGLSHWLPLHGCGTSGGTHDPRRGDTYNVRSNLSASLQFTIFFNQGDDRPDHPWEWQRRMIEEYRRARPLFSGDFYPLSRCDATSQSLSAMQFDRPDLGEGMVLAFRSETCPVFGAEFPLRGLVSDAMYELQDADSGESLARVGGDLMVSGLRIVLEQKRSSKLVFYRRVGGAIR